MRTLRTCSAGKNVKSFSLLGRSFTFIGGALGHVRHSRVGGKSGYCDSPIRAHYLRSGNPAGVRDWILPVQEWVLSPVLR